MFYFCQMRYALKVSYLGTAYHGWQKQPNAKTVQETLEQSLSIILQDKIEVLASGRTDTGVHSSDQVVHFDTEKEVTQKNLYKVNKHLPVDIAIQKYACTDEEFHARFSAGKRSYIYTIDTKKNPFSGGQSYQFSSALNIEKLNTASSYLVGRQDFRSFSKVKTEVSNFYCEITHAEWKLHGTQLCFYISANRFLRGMVRALVGTLLEVGLEKQSPEWIKEVIESQDRSVAGRNVPPEGLSLCKVEYPDHLNWLEIN